MENDLYNNEYEDGRIIIDSKMRGSDEEVQNWSKEDKQKILIDFMDWAESNNDWLANEMNDYFNQVFKDNGLEKVSDFLRDTELINAVFQEIYKVIPETEVPQEAKNTIDIEEDVKVGNIILEAGDRIKVLKEADIKTAKCPTCGNKYFMW